MPSKRTLSVMMWTLNALAIYQFIRHYVVSTKFYLNVWEYLAGHERLPFQERVLPIFLIRGMLHSQVFNRLLENRKGALSPPVRGDFFLISLVAFAVAVFFSLKLYRAVSTRGTLGFLVTPIFVYTSMWSYSIRVDQNYSYPYDLMSLAFFTAGLFCIYAHRFWPLLLIMFLGTLNRETTLFLVFLYMLDAATIETAGALTKFGDRFQWRQIPWVRTAALLAVWVAIKLTLAHIFAGNDKSEDYVRLKDNLVILNPKNWPGALNICGYLLPATFVLRRSIDPVRFANYMYVLVPWFLVMVVTGLLLETRIYGELSGFVAVAAVLQLEHYVAFLPRSSEAEAV